MTYFKSTSLTPWTSRLSIVENLLLNMLQIGFLPLNVFWNIMLLQLISFKVEPHLEQKLSIFFFFKSPVLGAGGGEKA